MRGFIRQIFFLAVSISFSVSFTNLEAGGFQSILETKDYIRQSSFVQRHEYDVLRRHPELTLEACRRLATDENPDIRRKTFQVLEQLGEVASSEVGLVMEGLQDADEEVQRGALFAFDAIGSPCDRLARDRILNLPINHSDWNVRSKAGQVLQRRCLDADLPPLEDEIMIILKEGGEMVSRQCLLTLLTGVARRQTDVNQLEKIVTTFIELGATTQQERIRSFSNLYQIWRSHNGLLLDIPAATQSQFLQMFASATTFRRGDLLTLVWLNSDHPPTHDFVLGLLQDSNWRSHREMNAALRRLHSDAFLELWRAHLDSALGAEPESGPEQIGSLYLLGFFPEILDEGVWPELLDAYVRTDDLKLKLALLQAAAFTEAESVRGWLKLQSNDGRLMDTLIRPLSLALSNSDPNLHASAVENLRFIFRNDADLLADEILQRELGEEEEAKVLIQLAGFLDETAELSWTSLRLYQLSQILEMREDDERWKSKIRRQYRHYGSLNRVGSDISLEFGRAYDFQLYAVLPATNSNEGRELIELFAASLKSAEQDGVMITAEDLLPYLLSSDFASRKLALAIASGQLSEEARRVFYKNLSRANEDQLLMEIVFERYQVGSLEIELILSWINRSRDRADHFFFELERVAVQMPRWGESAIELFPVLLQEASLRRAVIDYFLELGAMKSFVEIQKEGFASRVYENFINLLPRAYSLRKEPEILCVIVGAYQDFWKLLFDEAPLRTPPTAISLQAVVEQFLRFEELAGDACFSEEEWEEEIGEVSDIQKATELREARTRHPVWSELLLIQHVLADF